MATRPAVTATDRATKWRRVSRSNIRFFVWSMIRTALRLRRQHVALSPMSSVAYRAGRLCVVGVVERVAHHAPRQGAGVLPVLQEHLAIHDGALNSLRQLPHAPS